MARRRVRVSQETAIFNNRTKAIKVEINQKSLEFPQLSIQAKKRRNLKIKLSRLQILYKRPRAAGAPAVRRRIQEEVIRALHIP